MEKQTYTREEVLDAVARTWMTIMAAHRGDELTDEAEGYALAAISSIWGRINGNVKPGKTIDMTQAAVGSYFLNMVGEKDERVED